MRVDHRSVLLCVVLATLPGVGACSSCGGEGEGEGAGEGEGEGAAAGDAAELCAIYERGVLTLGNVVAESFALQRCAAGDIVVAAPANADVAIAAACAPTSPVFQDFDTAVSGGRVTFHMEAIRACGALSLQQLIASNSPTLPTECAGASLFTSNVTEGGVCVQQWDCAADLLCEADPIDQDGLRCLAPAQEGQGCTADVQANNASSTLTARTCASDLRCVDAVCTRKAAVGDACSGSADCADGLYCDTDAVDPTCAALLDDGAPCTSVDQCSSGNCDIDGLCAPAAASGIADGQACAVGDGCAQSCSTCRPTTPGGATSTCLDRGTAGVACLTSNDCKHGFVCDDAAHACVAGGTAGDPCSADVDCVDGFVCGIGAAQSTCVARPGVGEPCGSDTTQRCTGGTCAGTVCVAGAVGDPCVSDDNCTTSGVQLQSLKCRASDHTCQAAPTSGACSVGSACAGGLVCDSAAAAPTCVPLPLAGDPCVGTTCSDGLFCDDTTTCTPTKGTGSACVTDEECSGVCAAGTCSAVGASCTTSKSIFPILVLYSGFGIVRRRFLRDLRKSRR